MSKRPEPNFVTEADAVADLERLRLGYEQSGGWSLPQVAWHCWTLSNDVIRTSAATPPGGEAPTDSQKQAQGFIDGIVSAGHWPMQKFDAPTSATPSADVSEKAVDDLVAMLRAMAAFPHARIAHPFFGSVPIGKFRAFVLIHLAHHLSFLAPTTTVRRTNARYADLDAMIADIAHLRKGYTRGGNWSLPEICWHLNLAFPMPFTAADAQPQLDEAQTSRQARWDYYIAHGNAPAGFQAPATYVPPPTTNEADIDGLIERLAALRDFAGPFINTAAGVMPIGRARGFMLAHGWLHLSCLHPTRRRREHLSFASEQGVVADICRLRAGYSAAGNWSLAQVCWHLATVTPYPPEPGDPNALTTRQQAARPFLDAFKQSGGPPPGFQAPKEVLPPASCDDSAIDEYIKKLTAFAAFNEPYIQTDAFGAVETPFYRQLTLGHAARHLSFLRPIHGPREGLRFADENAAIADIRSLRKGYKQVGGWSLPQICWHLDQTMQARMKPGPHAADTDEQKSRRPILERVLTTGELPKGIVAPAPIIPPSAIGDAAIDACIATFERLRDFPGPIAPHRIFGSMPDDVARRQNLIHVAHHLSHLIPTEGARGEGQGARK